MSFKASQGRSNAYTVRVFAEPQLCRRLGELWTASAKYKTKAGQPTSKVGGQSEQQTHSWFSQIGHALPRDATCLHQKADQITIKSAC